MISVRTTEITARLATLSWTVGERRTPTGYRDLPRGRGLSKDDGHLYVLAFDFGVIKVGAARDPLARIAKHAATAASYDRLIVGGWVSNALANVFGEESRLLDWCAERVGRRGRSEFFTALDFEETVARAGRLGHTRGDPRREESDPTDRLMAEIDAEGALEDRVLRLIGPLPSEIDAAEALMGVGPAVWEGIDMSDLIGSLGGCSDPVVAKDVAELLGCDVAEVERWVGSGAIRAARIRRAWWVPQCALVEFVHFRRVEGLDPEERLNDPARGPAGT